MKRLLLLCLLLAGCGSNQPERVTVPAYEVVHTDQETIYAKSRQGGVEPWNGQPGVFVRNEPDGVYRVYILPIEALEGRTYTTRGGTVIKDAEDLYNWVLGHETRHDGEGSYHD